MNFNNNDKSVREYVKKLYIPKVTPRSLELNEVEVSEVKKLTDDWAQSFNKEKFEDKTQLFLYSLYCYPYADYEQKLWIAKFSILLGLIDELIDLNTAPDEDWVQIIKQKDSYICKTNDWLVKGMIENIKEAEVLMGKILSTKLDDVIILWIRCADIARKQRVESQVLSIDEYLDFRWNNFALRTCFVICEWTSGYVLDEKMEENEEVLKFLKLCNSYCALTNDIISFKREFLNYDNGGNTNSIEIVSKEENCDFQTAIFLIFAKCHQILKQIKVQRQRIIDLDIGNL